MSKATRLVDCRTLRFSLFAALFSASLVVSGCSSVRYIGRGESFQVTTDEAAAIDNLDEHSPAQRSSRTHDELLEMGRVTFADCTYWRKARLDAANQTATVQRYVESRTNHVCNAFPNVFEDTTPAAMEKVIQKRTAGFQKIGDTIEGALGPFETHRFSLVRGQCYVVVLRLLPGFTAREAAKKYVRFAAISEGVQVLETDGPDTELGSDHLHGRGAAIDVGCPWTPGPVRIEADPGDIASGKYAMELWQKPVDEGELTARQQAARDSAADNVVEAKRHFHQACADCRDMYNYCVAHPGPDTFDCKAHREECVRTTGGELKDCTY